jgi:hypothetical protein
MDLIGNEAEFFYNFLEKYRIYLAARGSIFETQKQTIPEQKETKNKKTCAQTNELAATAPAGDTHTSTSTENTLPEELLKTLLWLKNGLWFINTGSWVMTF